MDTEVGNVPYVGTQKVRGSRGSVIARFAVLGGKPSRLVGHLVHGRREPDVAGRAELCYRPGA